MGYSCDPGRVANLMVGTMARYGILLLHCAACDGSFGVEGNRVWTRAGVVRSCRVRAYL